MLVNLGLIEWLPEAITTRREQFTCPNCRSLIQVKGVPDATVGNFQELYCPVCQQMWWVNSWRQEERLWPLPITFPTTYKWYVDAIIKRGPEPIPKPVPTDRPPVGGGWPEVTKQVWLDYKKIAFYGFLILASLLLVKQVTQKILK